VIGSVVEDHFDAVVGAVKRSAHTELVSQLEQVQRHVTASHPKTDR
jgi:hypothetical protein